MDSADYNKEYFTSGLTAWHATINNRCLPWKNEKDPYRIWLSEVILQQTRAQQGLPYYIRFTEAYPTINDLAAAGDNEVFRLWQGLGYYNRCKNMLATARYIAGELGGNFPRSYEDILGLKGIGPYTAAAISSFAYGLPRAVVDGNVYRVLARFFRIDIPFDTTGGKQYFADLAAQLLDKNDSAGYNQAIMDLGATVCLPRKARCTDCPLQPRCSAYLHNVIDLFPVRSKRVVVSKRYFHYLILKLEESIWIQKRTARDIWENLHEPFLIESMEPMDVRALSLNEQFLVQNFGYTHIELDYSGKQRLTHQIIEARFLTVYLNEKPHFKGREGKWMTGTDLENTPFPKTVLSFLKNNFYF